MDHRIVAGGPPPPPSPAQRDVFYTLAAFQAAFGSIMANAVSSWFRDGGFIEAETSDLGVHSLAFRIRLDDFLDKRVHQGRGV